MPAFSLNLNYELTGAHALEGYRVLTYELTGAHALEGYRVLTYELTGTHALEGYRVLTYELVAYVFVVKHRESDQSYVGQIHTECETLVEQGVVTCQGEGGGSY